MKRFTVKDFIAYNNPCFSCSNPINFRIGFLDTDNPQAVVSYLRPTVTGLYTEIELKIKYAHAEALKLLVFHKTNKILTNSNQGLTEYLSSHKLFLTSSCDRCYTLIESQYLDFNLEKGYLNAVGIWIERLMVNDDANVYQINSNFLNNESELTVDRIDKAKPLSPFRIKLSLLPKYRFKDKEHFLRKIKTYMTFS